MSSSDRPRREVAHRVFACEYNDATYTYRESDEDRAPNYLVTPSGARVNRVFVVGVLTEVEQVGDDVLRARVVDPTGAFVVYAGQYQPDALAFFEDVDPPLFVAVTGKANTFQPEDSDRIFTSIRPEAVTEVDEATRDQWVVNTAERTLDRISLLATVLDRSERGASLATVLRESEVEPSLAAGIPKALEEYGTTKAYLAELRDVALDALRQVAGTVDEVATLERAPGDKGDVSSELVFNEEEWSFVEGTDDDEPSSTDRTVEEPSPEAGSVGERVGTEPGAGAPAEAEPAGQPGETVEREADDGGTGAGSTAVDDQESQSPDDTVDDEELYELDDEERAEVEDEYGVEFNSGNEIPDAGEAEIETPTTEDDTSDDSEQATESATAEDDAVDLEDAVVERMHDLADGGAVPRDQLVDDVASNQDVSADAVEDAIQDALMSGRCYESGDNELTPI